MAAANIIATGNTLAASADIVVAAGSPITLALKGVVDDTAEAIVGLKDDAGGWQQVGRLDNDDPILVITAPGTYRVTRAVGKTCGVFSA